MSKLTSFLAMSIVVILVGACAPGTGTIPAAAPANTPAPTATATATAAPPTEAPTAAPPTPAPTHTPTAVPTEVPTAEPTEKPTVAPTETAVPTATAEATKGITAGITSDRELSVQNVANNESPVLKPIKEVVDNRGEVILSVKPDIQDRALSCESSVAGMAASYFRASPPDGYNGWEDYFIKTVQLNFDPHIGFSGSIDGSQAAIRLRPADFEKIPSYGMGVYAEPIQKAMLSVGIPSRVEYGTSEADLKAIEQYIRKGFLVGVWMFNPNYCTDSIKGADGKLQFLNCNRFNEVTMKVKRVIDGREVLFIEGEHIVLINGVRNSPRQFRIIDPADGSTSWVDSFSHWEQFDGMRIVVGTN